MFIRVIYRFTAKIVEFSSISKKNQRYRFEQLSRHLIRAGLRAFAFRPASRIFFRRIFISFLSSIIIIHIVIIIIFIFELLIGKGCSHVVNFSIYIPIYIFVFNKSYTLLCLLFD